MSAPVISVIVPCYNQVQYLDECLQSVLDQTYQDWECIIVNDGSPDNTEQVAKKWVERDSRFKYFYKENGGLSSARNFGIKKSEGDWIQFLDCDDYISNEKFEIIFNIPNSSHYDILISNFFGYNNELVLPHCKLEEVDFSLKSILEEWDIKFTIPIHCAVIRKDIFGMVAFNESLKAKEDFLFWVDVFKLFPKVIFINEYLNFYRIHGKNMTLDYTHMITNKLLAYKLIHNGLDIISKDVFFNARIDMLFNENKYYFESKQELLNSRRMKIFSRLDKFLKNLQWERK